MVVAQLGGENPDQRHVVLVGDRAAPTGLVQQEADFFRVEIAVAPELFLAQQVVHISRRLPGKKRGDVRGAIGLLVPLENLPGQMGGHRPLEQELLVQRAHLQARVQAIGELDHPVIQKGEAPFHRIRHQHPVALGAQQVAAQQGLGFQILRAVERMPAAERGRQPAGQLGDRILAQRGVEFRREKDLALRGGEPAGQMTETGLIGMVQTDAVKIAQIGFRLGAGGFQIGIQRLEQQGTPFGPGMTRPELANLGFLEQIVTAQRFVGAFAGQHHLVARSAHQAGQPAHGRGGGAQDGGFGMEDRRREILGNVAVMAKDAAVLHAQVLDQLLLKRRFVERLVLEANGKGLERRSRVAANQSDQRRGIQPAGQIGPDRDIRAQADAGGVGQQFVQLLGQLGVRTREVVALLGEAPVPVHRLPHMAVFQRQPVAGRDFKNALKQGVGAARRPEGEDLIQRRRRDAGRFRQQGQQRLDFRSEQQPLALAGVEQRQDADPIPNQQQALAVGVPQRDGELAVQVLHEIVAILLVGMDDDLGVAVGAEPVPRFQQDLAQLDVIENLAVERDPDGPVLVGHGLSAAGEVDDAQAGVAQTDPTVGIEVDAAVIRTAVAQGRQHAAHVQSR